MGKELVVSSDRHETKVAILEEGQLVEIYFQRGAEYSLAGSIHKGRVTRVLPGMQSAFVDLGLERDTFLYVTDFFEENEDFDRIAEDKRVRHEQPRREEIAIPAAAALSELPLEVRQPVEQAAAAASAGNGEPAAAREERRFDDRRGGRRRRRRGGPGGGRFPDSKFATASPAEESTPEPVVRQEREQEQEEDAEPIVLPGESLRKYQRDKFAAAPRREEVVPKADVPEIDIDAEIDAEPELEREDPVQLLAPVPEPDAPIHHPTIGEGALPVEAAVEIEAAEIEEPEPDSSVDIDEPELSDEEPGEIEASDGAAPATVAEDDSLQPPLEPMGHTAHLREPAVRFLEQRPPGRRNRRRGRGGDRDRRPDNRPPENRPPDNRQDRPERPEQRAERQERTDRPERPDRDRGGPQPSITDLLKEGQEILVQIAKEPLGQKGARITSHIALPGRYCVYMPTVEHAGVSRKIASDEERQRLKRILLTHRHGLPGGFIIRTAGEGKTEAEIAADIQYLYNLWLDIRQKAEKKKAPAVIFHDLEIVERILRDQLSDDFKAIWCDSEEIYESVLRFVQRVMPPMIPRVKMFTRSVPIFDAFSISSELEKALRPKVWLKSGGYIVINQTEALVAIDINTGKFVGKTGRLEDTIVKINIEAVKEIVRQIRLRDLGGIIVIDFIDMDERKNRQKVMQALEEAMRTDRAPYKILQFNDFGLVAITRKRVKQSLERTLCQPCTYCEGAGYVRSVATVISEILAEARKIASAVEGKECLLRVNPEVAKVLKSTSNTYVEELEEILKRPVGVIADPVIHHEKFDLS